ncbi:class I SAM-dependent methyltransferase, partial [Streptomyces sp. NPDC093982]|uniref:class I SAM-dependent methyltransferase n=1 Tax=Streptomyces sp. NPDC093982 TaxID=3155077 RepID=UPI00343A5CD3
MFKTTTTAARTVLKDPSLRRSLTLFRAFLREQSDPEHCYTLLARDAVNQVQQYTPLAGRTVIDVGGGPGHFTREFQRHGARCYLFEPDLTELTAHGQPPTGAVAADGYLLPLADHTADITFSSNVLEHVADPTTFLSEMIRITRPGGLIYVSFTNWLSPWGGHEMAPWHYLGARRARTRYQRKTGKTPKHTLGQNLFPIHIGPTLRHIHNHPHITPLTTRSRYWPFLTTAITRIPALREIATWNLLLILQ